MPHPVINKLGLELLERCEGLSLIAYKDVVGVWTIGYGHTGNVAPGTHITQTDAEELLKDDLELAAEAVDKACIVDLTSNQFSALVCFTFNVGASAFRQSTLLKKLNNSDYNGAAAELLRWDRAGGVEIPGLAKRRAAEMELFLTE